MTILINGSQSAAANVILQARAENARFALERQQAAAAVGGYAAEIERLQEQHGAAYRKALAEFNAEWQRRGALVQTKIDDLARREAQALESHFAQQQAIKAQQAQQARVAEIQRYASNAQVEAARLGVSVEAYLAWRQGA